VHIHSPQPPWATSTHFPPIKTAEQENHDIREQFHHVFQAFPSSRSVFESLKQSDFLHHHTHRSPLYCLLIFESKEEKNKKNGSKKKAHRGQSVRYRSWWKQGNIKMAVSEDHASCWVHKDLTVTTKQIQALLTAAKASTPAYLALDDTGDSIQRIKSQHVLTLVEGIFNAIE